jgi:hypothetical protein
MNYLYKYKKYKQKYFNLKNMIGGDYEIDEIKKYDIIKTKYQHNWFVIVNDLYSPTENKYVICKFFNFEHVENPRETSKHISEDFVDVDEDAFIEHPNKNTYKFRDLHNKIIEISEGSGFSGIETKPIYVIKNSDESEEIDIKKVIEIMEKKEKDNEYFPRMR